MKLIKLIEDSAEQFGETGHIIFHPYLWHTALLDQEFLSAITTAKVDRSTGQVAELKGIKLYVAADPTPVAVYQDRILKAMIALQAPHLLEFV